MADPKRTHNSRKRADRLRLAVLGHLIEGKTLESLATELGVARSTIYEWGQRPEWEAEVTRLLDERRSVAWRVRAWSVLEDLLESKNEKIRLGAATEILDRLEAPLIRQQMNMQVNINNDARFAHVTREDVLEEIRLLEEGDDTVDGEVIDGS